VTEAGSRRISLAWQPPDGSLDLYEINYWTNQFNYSISVAYSLLPNVTVYGLQPYTVYIFTVSGEDTFIRVYNGVLNAVDQGFNLFSNKHSLAWDLYYNLYIELYLTKMRRDGHFPALHVLSVNAGKSPVSPAMTLLDIYNIL
jgi:Fibronectin type III domain